MPAGVRIARALALLRSDAGPVRGLLEAALEALGRPDDAAALAPLKQAAELSPENAPAHRLLGMAPRGWGKRTKRWPRCAQRKRSRRTTCRCTTNSA